MRERPILYIGPMVRATLEGLKKQTRRVVKGDPKRLSFSPFACKHDDYLDEHGNQYSCPYGVPGDRLWVKETFYAWGTWEQYYDGNKKRCRFLDHTDSKHPVKYPATEGNRFYQGPSNGGDDYHCRPSIFMKRKYSRITLDVTDVRVERVQNVSEKDSRSEGIFETPRDPGFESWSTYGMREYYATPRRAFKALWDSINAKRGYSWESNPLVWVVEFRVM